MIESFFATLIYSCLHAAIKQDQQKAWTTWLTPPGALASQYMLHPLVIFWRRKEKGILPLECYLKPENLRKQCMIKESFWKHPGFYGESGLSLFSSKEYYHILIWINELNPLGSSRCLGKINSDVFYTKKNIPSSKNLWSVMQNWLSSCPLSEIRAVNG